MAKLSYLLVLIPIVFAYSIIYAVDKSAYPQAYSGVTYYDLSLECNEQGFNLFDNKEEFLTCLNKERKLNGWS